MPDNYRLRACIGNNEPMDVATRNNVTRVGDADGPTLVLAHGFGCDQQLWHPVAARLRDRFAKLVMITPSPRYIDDDGYRGGFTRLDIDELLESLESNYLGWSQAMAPTIMGNPDRPELAEDLEATFCRTDPAAAKVFARATFLSDNRADLARVSVPTLIVDCRQDAIAPPEVGAYVRDHIPGAQLITLDATGHRPHVSAPDVLIDEIRELLVSFGSGVEDDTAVLALGVPR